MITSPIFNGWRIPRLVAEEECAYAPFMQYTTGHNDGNPGEYYEPYTGSTSPIQRKVIQDGDIAVLSLITFDESSSLVQSGWAQVPGSPFSITSTLRQYVYWKRVSTTEPTVTTTATTGAQTGRIAFFRGAIETGDPWEDTASVSGTGTSITFPSLTSVDPYSTYCAMLAGTSGTLTGTWVHNIQNPAIKNLRQVNWGSSNLLGAGILTGALENTGATGTTTCDFKESVSYIGWCGVLKPANRFQPYSVHNQSIQFPTMLGYLDYGLRPRVELGDYQFAMLETNNEAVTLRSGDGWGEAPGSPVSVAGATPTRLSVFYRKLTADIDVPLVTDVDGDHVYCTMVTLRGASIAGNPFDFVTTSAGGTGTASVVTNGTTTVDNTLILNAVARNSSISGAQFDNWINADIAGFAEISDNGTTQGTGGGLGVASGTRAVAGAIGTSTTTITTSTEHCAVAVAVKPSGVSAPTIIDTRAQTGSYGDYGVIESFATVEANDLLVAFVESSREVKCVLPEYGWQKLSAGTVTNAGTTITVFWRRCSGKYYDPWVTSSHNHIHGTMPIIRGLRADGDIFDFTATNSGTGTSISIPGGTTTQEKSVILGGIATTRDADSFGNTFRSWSNPDVSKFAILDDVTRSTGTGGGVGTAAGYKPTIGSVDTTTATQLVSASWAAWQAALKATDAPACQSSVDVGYAPYMATSTGSPGNNPLTFFSPATFIGQRWGLQDGDIAVCAISAGETVEIVSPAGYAHVPGSPFPVGNGTYLNVIWKRVTAQEALPSSDLSAVQPVAQCFYIRGALETGSPWGDIDYVTGTGTTVNFPSLDTTEDNNLIIHLTGSQSNSSSIDPLIKTLNNSNLQYLARHLESQTSGSSFAVSSSFGDKAEAGTVVGTALEFFSSKTYVAVALAVKPALVRKPRMMWPSGSTVAGYSTEYGFYPMNKVEETKHAFVSVETSNEAVTMQTPGWTEVPGSPVINAGTNPTRLSVFYKKLTDVELDIPATFGLVGYGSYTGLLQIRGAVESGDPFENAVTGTGTGTTAAVIPGSTTSLANSLVIQLLANGLDNLNGPMVSGEANGTLSGLTAHYNFTNTTGNGVGAALLTGGKAVAGAYGTTTATLSSTEAYAAWTAAIKPQDTAVMPTVIAATTALTSSAYPGSRTFSSGVLPNDLFVVFTVTDTKGAPVIYPSSWTQAPSTPFDGTGFGLSVAWCRATGNYLNPVVTVGGLNDHALYNVLTIKGLDDDPVVSTVTNTGIGTTATVGGGTTTEDNQMVLCIVSSSKDSSSNNTFGPWTNADLDGMTMMYDQGTPVGNGGVISTGIGYKDTPGAFGTSSLTLNTSNEWAAMRLILKGEPNE